MGETDEEGLLPQPLPALREILLLVDHRDFLPAVVTGEELVAAQGKVVLQQGRTWKGRAEIGVLPGAASKKATSVPPGRRRGTSGGPSALGAAAAA